MKGLGRYYGKKILWYLITLVIALVINFALPRMIPGNPVSQIVTQMTQSGGLADSNAYKKIYDSFNEEFGLDQPIVQQFFTYVGNLFKGDMGTSFTQYPRKVQDILATALPWTIGLQLPAILIGWIIGNLLGAVAAYRRGVFDKVMFPITLFLNSVPAFSFSLVLLYVFAVSLGWFPIGGGYPMNMIPSFSWHFFSALLWHYWLPFLSLVLVAIGGQAIGMRSMVLYELNSDYVLYAKLMGVKDRKVVGYVFKNAMLPQITGLALMIGTMTAGALITEIVFSYPGIGTTMFKAIKNTDYTLISGCTLVITLMVLSANFIIEIVYGFVDPRVRSVQQEEGQ